MTEIDENYRIPAAAVEMPKPEDAERIKNDVCDALGVPEELRGEIKMDEDEYCDFWYNVTGYVVPETQYETSSLYEYFRHLAWIEFAEDLAKVFRKCESGLWTK